MRRNLLKPVLICLIAFLVLYSAVDLFWPFHRDLRAFTPAELADLETGMWRSYYSKKFVALFFQLAEVLRTQYQFPPLRSFIGAYHAARAAFIFKEGTRRAEYEAALPSLVSYFGAIHRIGNINFDVTRASHAELEWWIVHRERKSYPPDALGRACAEAASALYRVPADSLMEHGNLRAAAMVIRDTRQDSGAVREEDWNRIDSLLRRCYASLHGRVAGE